MARGTTVFKTAGRVRFPCFIGLGRKSENIGFAQRLTVGPDLPLGG